MSDKYLEKDELPITTLRGSLGGNSGAIGSGAENDQVGQ